MRLMILQLSVWLLLFWQGAHGEMLTLGEAVREALQASPSIRVAAARMDAASAAVERAKSQQRPYVGLGATYMQTNQPMQAFGLILNQRSFSNDIDFNAPGQVDSLGMALGAEQVLYSAGRLRENRRAAEATRGAVGRMYEATLQELSLEVARTYLNILQQRKGIQAIEAALRASQANLDVAVEKERAGNLHRRDVLDMEVQHASLEKALLAAKNAERLMMIRLRVLLGRDAQTGKLEVAGHDPAIRRLTAPEAAEVRERPELLALSSQAQAASSRLRAARAGRMPVAGAFASVQAERGWRTGGDGSSWTAGVKVELPLFDGFLTRSEIRSALAEEKIVREQLRELELQLEMETEQARLAHELATAQLAVSQRQAGSAKLSAELARERFNAGALSTADLLEAESQLVQAEMAVAEAFYRERTAILELRRAMGLPLF